MRPFWRVLRRFWIVTLGGAVGALNLLGWEWGYPRAGTGIEAGRHLGTPLSLREGGARREAVGG